MPRQFGSSSTVHRYFQRWIQAGIFYKLWKLALQEYDDLIGVKWDHQSIDTAHVKAPIGGAKTGRNPTDRGKRGSKTSIIVDGRGVPIGFELAGSKVHDSILTFDTIDSIPLNRPRTQVRKRQHFHADKGYDRQKTRTRLRMRRYIPQIRKRRRRDKSGRPVVKRDHHRWKIERSHSWSNRYRGLKKRWEKKAINYIGLCQLSFTIIALRFAGVLG